MCGVSDEVAHMTLVPSGHVPVATGAGEGTVDVLVPDDVPLAAVLAELELPAAVASELVGGAIAGGDASSDAQDPTCMLRSPAGRALSPGALVGAGGATSADSADRALEVAVVAGLASGRRTYLPPGACRLTSGTVLEVASPQGPPQAWSTAGAKVEVLIEPTGTDCSDVSVGAPAYLLAVSPVVDVEPCRAASFRRPPRVDIEDAVVPIEPPVLPPLPGPATPLSWASLLAPLPIGIAMAFFFRPLFALFALMGPVLVLGRWIEQRRSRRKQSVQREVALAAAQVQVRAELRAQRAAMSRDAWMRHPHIAHLRERAAVRSVRLWERRSDDDDRLNVVIGVGPQTAEPVWVSPPPVEISDRSIELVLRPTPHSIDLAVEQGLGCYGDLAAARAVIRAVVLQLATLRGPADLAITVLADDGDAWDGLKWLPHLDARLQSDPQDPGAWAGLRASGVLLIVDDPQADVASVVRAADEAEVELTVLSIAAERGALPAACTQTVQIRADGSSDDVPHMLAVGITASFAANWARSLAAVDDPEQGRDEAATLLTAPSLAHAMGITGPDDVRQSYERRVMAAGEQVGLSFVLGADVDGAVAFDLVADGPHALIAGTTGSGKSELLRTFVLALAATVPPTDLAFVLVDFKGGGAFDGCADLPHVAGFITDLDDGVVARALAGLRAELREREERLRRGDHLSRLVVVIDEFAVLANDYPDVLDGLIDLAARGRSLGMHLILATQKPSGVVDHRIRANTNLRIALRVQHAHESHDVVGVPDASELDRRSPGRAIVRVGSDDVRTVQVCSTVAPAIPQRSGQRVVRFTMCAPASTAEPAELAEASAPLDVLAQWVSEAWSCAWPDGSTVGGPTNKVAGASIWLPSLPERISSRDMRRRLVEHEGSRPPGKLIGVVDVPEARQQSPYMWEPSTGGLVLFSGDAEPIQHLITGLVSRTIEDPAGGDVAYVVTSERHVEWESHACVGAVIAPTDRERIERLFALFERHAVPDAPTGRTERRLLAVSDIGSLLAGFDDLERLEIVERLEALARTGPTAGIDLVIGARSVRDLPHRVAQHLPHRLLGVVADPTAHLVLGTSGPPNGPPMHVVDVDTGHLVLLGDAPSAGSLEVRNRSVASRVERCPEFLAAGELPSPVLVGVDGCDGLDIPLGVRYDDLTPAVLPVRWGRDVLLAGPPGSGRSTTLDVIELMVEHAGCHVLRARDEGALAVLGELGGATENDVGAHSGEPVVVLVDDADRLPEDLAAALAALIQRRDRSATVVLASTIDDARSPRSLAASVRGSGSGLLLGGSQLDGEIFRIRRPDVPGLGRIAGRGTLVVGGRGQSVHLAARPVPRELDARG
jgi:S-DNA-T family DNA segregation ATPase FtsK/SpoIIIE